MYMACKRFLLITVLNKPILILLLPAKWFQELLFISNNSIIHQSFDYS